MLWIIERILERLFLRSALQMSSEKEAQIDLEQVNSRAELLRRAEALEKENVPGFDELAAGLRKRAAEMEAGAAAPGANVLRIAKELGNGGLASGSQEATPRLSPPKKTHEKADTGVGAKKRGRPRKHPDADSASDVIQ